jgi:hypothetical protein
MIHGAVTFSSLVLASLAITTIQAFTLLPHNSPVVVAKTRGGVSSSLFVEKSKWDNLVDEDDEEDVEDIPGPPDMKYNPRNCKRQQLHFLAIREAGGKELTNDIYVREPGQDTCWYAGKVARVSDVSLEQCVARQWAMIETHSANLRPLDLFPGRGKLEIFMTNGDSELEVAYNRPDNQMMKMERNVEGASKIKNSMVGFQGEVYQPGEDGFRTWLTEEGFPLRPEINQGGENRPPTQEELLQLQQELEGNNQDLGGDDEELDGDNEEL